MTKLVIESVVKNKIRMNNIRLQPLVTWLHFFNFITMAVLCLLFLKIYKGLVILCEWLFPPKHMYQNPVIMVIGPKNDIIHEIVYQLSQKFNSKLVDVQDLNDNISQISKPNQKQSQIIYSHVPVSSQDVILEIYKCVKKRTDFIDILVIAQDEDSHVENNFTHTFLNHLNKHLLAQFWTVMTFLPGMLRRNSGHIISVGLGRSSLTNTGIMRTIHEELMQSETKVKMTLVEKNTFFDGYLPSLSNDILARLIIRSMWNADTSVVKVPSLPCYLFILPVLIIRSWMRSIAKIVNLAWVRNL